MGFSLIFDYQKSILEKLKPFILPYLSQFNVQTFGYRKFLLDGRSFAISTNVEWMQFYNENLQGLVIPYYEKEIRQTIESGRYFYHLSDELDLNDPLCKNLYNFNIWNALRIYKREADCIDGFYFATTKEDKEFYKLASNHLEQFELFTLYFKEKFLEVTNMQKINEMSLPTVSRESFQQHKENIDRSLFGYFKRVFTRRKLSSVPKTQIIDKKLFLNLEVEILKHLSQGKNLEEIADFLKLSKPIIEDVLNKVKSKVGVHSKSKLIDLYRKNFKVEIPLSRSSHFTYFRTPLPIASKESLIQNTENTIQSTSNIHNSTSTSIALHQGINSINLSKREIECLLLLSRGKKIKEIARYLGISPRTVESYLENLKCKLNVYTRSELIDLYYANIKDELEFNKQFSLPYSQKIPSKKQTIM